MSVRFHHKHPLAFTACFLVLGAILGKHVIFFIAAVGILLFLTKRLCWREYMLSGLALALGFLSFNYQFKEYKNAQRALQNNYPIQVFVTAQSRNAKGLQIKALVKAYYKEGTWKVTPNYEVEWWQKEVLNIPPGSLIAIKGGKLKTPQKRQYSFLFDDEAYHLGQKKLGRLNLQNAQIYGLRCDSNSLEYKRFQYKHDILVRLEEVLSPRAHALFAGLILGDKSGITPAEKQQFQQAGLMHILSVSGMHLGLIYWLLSWPIKRLAKRNRKFKKLEILLLPIIWAYAFMTGMAPPVFRAAAFITAFLGTRIILKRSIRLSDLLASAACLQVFFDPLALFSVSFQLSFAAMLGIAFWFPHWQDIWERKIKKGSYLGDLLGMSLCCTLTTLPLTLYHFHAFPTWFLLGNLVFTLPFTALMYVFVALSLAVFMPFKGLSLVFSVISQYIISVIYTLLNGLSKLPLPYIYAFDFGFFDALFVSIGIYILWRGATRIPTLSIPWVKFAVLLWCIWGVFRVPQNFFSGEAQSGLKLSTNTLQLLGRFSQSQNIDTVYIRAVKTLQPME